MKLLLAETQTAGELHARLREHLPELAEWMEAHGRWDGDDTRVLGRVLGTRNAAKKLVEAHPEISGQVELDGQYVEVMTTPFVHEILKAWPQATFVNCNEDVAETIAIVRGRLPDA